MQWISSICVTFSTYTVIPVPRVKWDERSMRLAIGFLPLAGAAIGLALWLWTLLCDELGIREILFAAAATALPVFITGGIHLDGFCDTVDAISSRQTRERKLEILKDPNTGAFAVIYCIVYILLSFGLFTQAKDNIAVISFGYVLSRGLTAINAVTLPNARKTGMLVSFTENTSKRQVMTISILFTVAACVCMIAINLKAGLISVLLAALVTLWYRRIVLREFGGATGDTSGFLLQITEFAVLFGTVAGGFIA